MSRPGVSQAIRYMSRPGVSQAVRYMSRPGVSQAVRYEVSSKTNAKVQIKTEQFKIET